MFELVDNRQAFSAWRVVFGAYLAVYYLKILPLATALYSRSGMISSELAHKENFFPLFLLRLDQSAMVHGWVYLALGLSLVLISGVQRRVVSASLFFVELWMVSRNPYTRTPDLPFVQWLLLALALIPGGESFIPQNSKNNWQISPVLKSGAWITLALGYAYSAQGKLSCGEPAWLDGSALYEILNFSAARLSWYGDFFIIFPKAIFYPLTWAVIFFEALGPLLICFSYSRWCWLLVLTAMHFFVLPTFNLTQLTLGMLMFHGFIWSANWNEFVGVWRRNVKAAITIDSRYRPYRLMRLRSFCRLLHRTSPPE